MIEEKRGRAFALILLEQVGWTKINYAIRT